jgi:CHAT domain-containing protein/tetratricopeptide (TPR) repeat protein
MGGSTAITRKRVGFMCCSAALLCVLAYSTLGSARPHFASDSIELNDNALLSLKNRGIALYRSRRFTEAAVVFEQGRQQAQRRGAKSAAVRFLNEIGATQFARFQYRSAMQTYIEVRRQARANGDDEMLAAAAGNLSSLYLQQQELNASQQAGEEALDALDRHGDSVYGCLLRVQVAIVRARQGRFEAALPLFRQALGEAEARGDRATAGIIWNQLGYEWTERRELDKAEGALLEAFRIRLLNRLPDLQYSYYALGILYEARGDWRFASTLFDRAIAEVTPAGELPAWRLYYERGRSRMEEGRTSQALEDLRKAAESAKLLRVQVLPADSMLTRSGADQQRIYAELVRVYAELGRRTGNPEYARLAFEASEENRAAGLRALVYSTADYQRRLPPAYWEALAGLRAAESELMGRNSPVARQRANALQYRLTEMEAEAGLDVATPASGPASALERVRKALKPGEAFISFELSEPESYQWLMTPRSFSMRRLPGRSRISSLVRQFQRAVALDLPESGSLGEQLYGVLFGSIPPEVASSKSWALALNSELFQAPLAALVTGSREGKPVYLMEQRSLRLVPSALLLGSGDQPRWTGPFIGMGDPIYNAADQRRREASGALAGMIELLPRSLTGAQRRSRGELARLPGSGREIEACMGAWGKPSGSLLLSGQQCSLKGLNEALAQRPSVLHFATHFVKSAAAKPQVLMALSLDRSGSPELLAPVDIAQLRQDLALVVLSGCGSAEAESLPAEGLMGLTRAWLGAGAHSVMATLWPTSDGNGRLLVSFYSHLAKLDEGDRGGAAAEALRLTQLDMLRSDAWASRPGYWAPYVAIGKD